MAVKTWNDRIARTAANVLGMPFWFTALVVGIPTYFLVVLLSHGRVDSGFVTLLVVLTVQTSLDSGANNYLLRLRVIDQTLHQAAEDLRMEKIEALTVAMDEELDRARERDALTAARDSEALERDMVLIDLTNHTLDVLTELRQLILDKIATKGGSST